MQSVVQRSVVQRRLEPKPQEVFFTRRTPRRVLCFLFFRPPFFHPSVMVGDRYKYIIEERRTNEDGQNMCVRRSVSGRPLTTGLFSFSLTLSLPLSCSLSLSIHAFFASDLMVIESSRQEGGVFGMDRARNVGNITVLPMLPIPWIDGSYMPPNGRIDGAITLGVRNIFTPPVR